MRERALRIAEDPVRVEENRTVETEREINLTEAEVLEANLAALGVSTANVGKSPEEQVYEALASLMRERKSYVPNKAIAEVVGLSPNTITNILGRLATKGRVIQTVNPKTGKPCYVPRVAA